MSVLEFNKQVFRKAIMTMLDGRNVEHGATLDAVEKWMSSGKSGLILMGNIGTGKTTIAYALRRAWSSYLTIARVYKCDWIAEQVKMDESWIYEVSDNKGLLILDDLGTEQKVYGNESMLPILLRRYENRMPTVITTNLNCTQIKERYGERIADRFSTYSQIVMDYNSLRK